jgi:hypothetical protein
VLRIHFLPAEFGEVFRFDARERINPHVRATRSAKALLLKVQLEDYDEDDLVVAITNSTLVILGGRMPSGFCIYHHLPTDALPREARAELKEGTLEIEFPLRTANSPEAPQESTQR